MSTFYSRISRTRLDKKKSINVSTCWLAINKRAKRDASEIRLRATACNGVQKEYCSKGRGRKRQPKEFNINIVHAQTHGVDPAALPRRTRLLPSRGPLSSSEKTRPPPLRPSTSHHYQQPYHWDPRITFTESRPSPPPLLTGSNRHRHHRVDRHRGEN